MKKLIALLLVVLMILACVPTMSFAGRFEDVSDGKWYSEGISFCAANGYMTGTSEKVFDRSAELSRSMFVTILAKIDGADLTEYEGKSSFSDVKTDGWYTSAIEWAYQNKLASGIGSNKDGEPVFGYKNPVTREQMALFLYAYAEYVNSKGYEIVVPDIPIEYSASVDTTLRADLSVFSDADRVHSWAKDAMEWAVACDLFSGIGEDLLDPRGNCTRAQAAVLIRAYVLNFLSDCEHEWSEATCTEMSVCSKCDLKSATELGHDFAAHLCTESVKCSRCEETTETTEHILTELSCTEDSMCIVCGYVNAVSPGHTTENGICERCGEGIFPSAFDKLFYYLGENGDLSYKEDVPSFIYEEEDEEMKIRVRICRYENSGGRERLIAIQMDIFDYVNKMRYTTDTPIESPNQTSYFFGSSCDYLNTGGSYFGETLYRIGSYFAPENVNANGDFTLTYYKSGDNYTVDKEYAIEISKALFGVMFYITDQLIIENANMSLTDFGFNMTSFYE